MGEIIHILNRALATELSSALRSKRHYYAVDGREREDLRTQFLEHAVDEAQNADQLAERICELGGHPDYQAAAHAEALPDLSVMEMLEEDISAEFCAVDSYSEMILSIGDGDPVTRRLLEDILAKGIEHATDLVRLKHEVQS